MFGDTVEFISGDSTEIESEKLQIQAHRPPQQHESIHRDRGARAAHEPITESKRQYREEYMAAPNIDGVCPPQFAHERREFAQVFFPPQDFWNPKTCDAQDGQRTSADL